MSVPQRYKDIIDLPHYISPERTPMSINNRAAQFAPFAALTGYDEQVQETARLTDQRAGPDEERSTQLDCSLQAVQERLHEQPQVAFVRFVPDKKKPGGAYCRITGRVRRIDEVRREIILTDRTVISMDSLYAIELIQQNPDE